MTNLRLRLLHCTFVVGLAVSCGVRVQEAPVFVDGVGVGSDCSFTGEYSDIFPCQFWQGTQEIRGEIVSAGGHDRRGGGYIFLVSSRKIADVTGDVDGFQADGTLAIVRLGPSSEDVVFEVAGIDGSIAECRYYVPANRRELFECGDYRDG